MEQKFNPYLNYTSTAMLTGVDEDKLTRRSVEYFIKNIQPHLPSNRKSRIMEIGCGYGRHIKALQLLGYLNVMGIDISEEQVEYAKNKLGLNNVEVGDAVTILSENKEKYDAILLLDVIEHLELEYSIKLIKLIKFNLNANGVLIIHTPNAMTPLSPNRHWDVTHLRAYTTHSMEQTLRLGEFSKMIQNEVVIKGAKVLLLGVTFKENCPDIRNSKVVDIYNELKQFGLDVDVYDPNVDFQDVKNEYNIEIVNKLSKYDSIILAVSHNEFLKLNYESLKLNKNSIVYDIKSVLNRIEVNSRL